MKVFRFEQRGRLDSAGRGTISEGRVFIQSTNKQTVASAETDTSALGQFHPLRLQECDKRRCWIEQAIAGNVVLEVVTCDFCPSSNARCLYWDFTLSRTG